MDSKKGKQPILQHHLVKKRKFHSKPGLRKSDLSDYRKYRNRVAKLTERVYNEYKHILNPHDYPRTMNGVDGGWQLDHIHSVRRCFDNEWTIEQASHVSNLQMLPWKENLLKRDKM